MKQKSESWQLLNKIRNNIELIIEPSMFDEGGKDELLRKTLKLVEGLLKND